VNFGIDVVKILEYASKILRLPMWLVALLALSLVASAANVYFAFSRQDCAGGQHSSLVYSELGAVSRAASGAEHKLGTKAQTVFELGVQPHPIAVEVGHVTKFANGQNVGFAKLERLFVHPNFSNKHHATREVEQLGLSANIHQYQIRCLTGLEALGGGVGDLARQVGIPSGHTDQNKRKNCVGGGYPFGGSHGSSLAALGAGTRAGRELHSRGVVS
jgi:hypothetical protein